MPLGPVMLDVAGTALTGEDRQRLQHPLVGGVILFARNFESCAQLAQLTAEIHALRSPPLIIAVDHEGGRVQRFREGFTQLPPMRELGLVWDRDRRKAVALAQALGFVLAAELRVHGVDLSFTPVLDVDYGNSSVIGDRAFHASPEAIAELAIGLMHGLRDGGMAAVGKHFPGHGHVRADSHHEVPVDERTLADIQEEDLIPFRRMIDAGMGGIMPAHVIYPKVDAAPAGFSEIWIKRILRGELGFNGVIFSDDLSMEGASVAGGVVDRAMAALQAGWDMVLVCNNPQSADELLAGLHYTMPAVALARMARIHGRAHAVDTVKLREDARYVAALHAINGLGAHNRELPLA
ncbi:MAG: beta-N-acetylhexosaminidase [Betaproteobacteria bacterium]